MFRVFVLDNTIGELYEVDFGSYEYITDMKFVMEDHEFDPTSNAIGYANLVYPRLEYIIAKTKEATEQLKDAFILTPLDG